MMQTHLPKYWLKRGWMATLLLPFAALYGSWIYMRQQLYRWHILPSYRSPVPVIVVGNITVGGTGKTPLTAYLANFLQDIGYKPGIVSRGYGGKKTALPQWVQHNSDAALVGDEAVLLAQQVNCPIVVCHKRAAAIQMMLNEMDCNVIIADDGLQHYAMQRDIEIAVVDSDRRFGNAWLLPAGPLRETRSRLQQCDFIICNGEPAAGEYAMKTHSHRLQNLLNPSLSIDCNTLADEKVFALAGIGNPERFFNVLKNQFGLKNLVTHAFPDHFPYTGNEKIFKENQPIVMTQKDAVKCLAFATPNCWYLPITVELPTNFTDSLQQRLKFYAST